MKIALIGYGRMGKEIEPIAKLKGHNIVTIDPSVEKADYPKVSKESMQGVDVAIDFTHPSVVINTIETLASLGVTMVIGTTGWYDQMDHVKNVVEKGKVGLLWSGNFSIGMNLLFQMIKHGASLINNVEEYDIMAHEFHHNKKVDSPSGTANMIGNILLDNIDRKNSLVTERLDRAIEKNELHLSSTRGGSIPGTHSVIFDSPADTIEIKHTARSRAGFALGTVLAAQYIHKKTGVHHIDDLMSSLTGGA